VFDNIERDDNYTYVRSLSISLLSRDTSDLGRDPLTSHLTNRYLYLDSGDLQACDPTAVDPTNTSFVA